LLIERSEFLLTVLVSSAVLLPATGSVVVEVAVAEFVCEPAAVLAAPCR